MPRDILEGFYYGLLVVYGGLLPLVVCTKESGLHKGEYNLCASLAAIHTYNSRLFLGTKL